jgi:hypothetical protein
MQQQQQQQQQMMFSNHENQMLPNNNTPMNNEMLRRQLQQQNNGMPGGQVIRPMGGGGMLGAGTVMNSQNASPFPGGDLGSGVPGGSGGLLGGEGGLPSGPSQLENLLKKSTQSEIDQSALAKANELRSKIPSEMILTSSGLTGPASQVCKGDHVQKVCQ